MLTVLGGLSQTMSNDVSHKPDIKQLMEYNMMHTMLSILCCYHMRKFYISTYFKMFFLFFV